MKLRLRTFAVVAAAGLAVLAGCSSGQPNPAKPKTYLSLCAAALTKVQHSARELSGAELVPVEPSVLQLGPPVRVQCALSKGGDIGGVTFDAMCSDWQSAGCTRVTAAVMGGRVVYLGDEAKAKIEAARSSPGKHR